MLLACFLSQSRSQTLCLRSFLFGRLKPRDGLLEIFWWHKRLTYTKPIHDFSTVYLTIASFRMTEVEKKEFWHENMTLLTLCWEWEYEFRYNRNTRSLSIYCVRYNKTYNSQFSFHFSSQNTGYVKMTRKINNFIQLQNV